jgi:hypothetical protein
MPFEDVDSQPPMARLYDVMQQRSVSTYRRRSTFVDLSEERRGRRSFTSVSEASRNPQMRKPKFRSYMKSTPVVPSHRGDVGSESVELGIGADVPPAPTEGLSFAERKLRRSPLTDSSSASTADL